MRKQPMPDNVRAAWLALMALYFDDDERAYLRASAAFGTALASSGWLERLHGRPRMVGV